MAVKVLFFLILASFAVFFPRWKKCGLAFLGLAFGWLVLVGNGIVPSVVMDILEDSPRVARPEWKKKNAIILLGSGILQWRGEKTWFNQPIGLSRLHQSARLYHLCRLNGGECKIISSGGDLYRKGISEAKVMAIQLTEIGVPESDIILEERSNNTYENARFTAPIIRSGGFDQIYVVTNGFHMKRSLVLFNHFKIKGLPAPSDHFESEWSVLPKGSSFYWADLGLHELGGMVKFHVWNSIGWEY